jgi:hypothetical protein
MNFSNSSGEAAGIKSVAEAAYKTHKIVPVSKAVPDLFSFSGCSKAMSKYPIKKMTIIMVIIYSVIKIDY